MGAIIITGFAVLAMQAATPEASCPAPAQPDGWTAQQGVTAGAGVAAPVTLAIGRSARAELLPVSRITYPAPPSKAAGADSMGGVFAFDAATAGAYRVALSSAVWVDVVAGDKELASEAHGHGPDCSGIRKYVDFRVASPGRYLVQVSGSATPSITVMISRIDG